MKKRYSIPQNKKSIRYVEVDFTSKRTSLFGQNVYNCSVVNTDGSRQDSVINIENLEQYINDKIWVPYAPPVIQKFNKDLFGG